MQYPIACLALRYCRRTSVVFVLLSAIALAACSKVELERAEGAPLAWNELRGQWVLVNYWAEWCKPCLKEIPELNVLNQDSSITVLGVNFDGIADAELRQLGQRMGIDFDLLNTDPAPQFDWQTPIALPATMVINPDGDLQQVLFGEQTQASIRAAISQ